LQRGLFHWVLLGNPIIRYASIGYYDTLKMLIVQWLHP